MQLGRRYAEGQGVPKDTAKALQLLQSAYDKDWSGRAEAAYYLGRMYDDGNGVPEDKQKAFELFDYAWSKGVKQAAYPLARAYDEGVPVKADRSRALELYRAAAKNGDARAHLRLAELEAEDGAPKEQVYDEAAPGVAWLRGLAKEDNDWAEGRLATIYEEGKVAPPDPELADRYLHDAAQHGNASANVKLAEREEQGGDPKKAMAYWRAAAEEGHPSGMVHTGFDAIDGGRTREGLSWLERAAALGHPSAMAEIGRRQLSGDGEPKTRRPASPCWRRPPPWATRAPCTRSAKPTRTATACRRTRARRASGSRRPRPPATRTPPRPWPSSPAAPRANAPVLTSGAGTERVEETGPAALLRSVPQVSRLMETDGARALAAEFSRPAVLRAVRAGLDGWRRSVLSGAATGPFETEPFLAELRARLERERRSRPPPRAERDRRGRAYTTLAAHPWRPRRWLPWWRSGAATPASRSTSRPGGAVPGSGASRRCCAC